jgi:hypothetical protein
MVGGKADFCIKSTFMTPSEIRKRQIERYRLMTGEQRLLVGLRLHELSCQIARDAIRARFPRADALTIEEKLHERLRLVASGSNEYGE